MTIAIRNNLVHTRKKDLTIFAFALIMARATLLKIVVVLLLAPPRQNFQKVKKNFAVIFTKNVPRGTPHPNANENYSHLAGIKKPAEAGCVLAWFMLGVGDQIRVWNPPRLGAVFVLYQTIRDAFFLAETFRENFGFDSRIG
jgi:hypothetical protein